MISLSSLLLVSAFLFSAGLACVLIRRNLIQILMGVELVLNAAALNFVAFSHFTPAHSANLALSGHVIAVFVIVLAAAEAVVALAMLLSVFKLFHSVHADVVTDLRG